MDSSLEDYAEKALQRSLDLGCQFCDVRAEQSTLQGFVIENNEMEFTTSKIDQGIGIRLLNSGAWGFFSISNPKSLEDVITGVNLANKNSVYSSSLKKNKVIITDSPIYIEKVSFPIDIEPTLEELINIGFECDKIISSRKRIIKSFTSINSKTVSKYFINSDGSKINQDYTDTIADLSATAHESSITQSVNITEGGRGGTEQLTENNKIQKSAEFISDKASQLIDAKPAKMEKSKVIMDPDFVSLLTHEILGHPSEADSAAMVST